MLPLGHYPTPVERVEGLSAPGSELWIKRDDRAGDVYGGNKVRKLEWLLLDARERVARRVVTGTGRRPAPRRGRDLRYAPGSQLAQRTTAP